MLKRENVLGAPDASDNRAAAAAVRAGRAVNPTTSIALRADIFSSAGSSSRGLVAGVELRVRCLHRRASLLLTIVSLHDRLLV